MRSLRHDRIDAQYVADTARGAGGRIGDGTWSIQRDGAGAIGTLDVAETAAFAALQKAAQAVQSQQRVVDQFRHTIRARAQPSVRSPIPDGVTAIYLEADEGTALSNVSLGGDDATVSVIELVVEKGEAPLYASRRAVAR